MNTLISRKSLLKVFLKKEKAKIVYVSLTGAIVVDFLSTNGADLRNK